MYVRVLDLPDIRTVYPGIETTIGAVATPDVEWYSTIKRPAEHELAMYLHSAGSTGLPKLQISGVAQGASVEDKTDTVIT